MLDKDYINLMSAPISADDYAGDDARYTSEFEALEEELAKDSSVHRTTGTDWAVVRERAEALLQTQSKDLRVACWLVWSLYQTVHFTGLAAGLAMLRHGCAAHWQALHPQRIRTRTATISWLCSRLEEVLGEQAPESGQLDIFSAIATELRELDRLFIEHLGDAAPPLNTLSRRVEQLLERADTVAQPASAASPTQAAAAPPTPAPAAFEPSAPPAGAPIVDSRDAHRSLRALQDQAKPLIAWWQHHNPSDVRAIRLARTLLWLPIDSLPGHDAEQITALRNLPADRLKGFHDRFNQGQFQPLLTELEGSLNRAPFWLSGQYLAWRCHEALGAEPAMQEIESQLRQLLARLPGLEQLRFHDGEPFADTDTRHWLGTRVKASTTTVTATAAESCSDGAAPWQQGLQEALALLRRDGPQPAMQLLAEGARQSEGDRDRFHWQLAQAQLCFHARQHEAAFGRLNALLHQLQSAGLERWEPTLNLEVLRLLYACCELLPQSQLVRDRREEIFHRLCHFDLEVVLNKALGPSM